MNSRKQNISIEQYLQKEGCSYIPDALARIKVEGEFNPRNDTALLDIEENKVAHYKIKGYDKWGVTFPRTKTLLEASKQGILFGYFHQHENERVYVRPYCAPEDDSKIIIPCLECGVGIVGNWKHQHS